MSPRRIVVLGADEQQGRDVARALETFTDRDRSAIVEQVSTDQVRPPGAWSAALDRLEAADVVVVVVTDGTVADVSWCCLVVHAVAWRTGIVALVADATPLTRWPFGLRDAMPPTIDIRDHTWPAELANIVRELEPDRPDPWIQPPRPEPPIIGGLDSESPTSDRSRHEHVGEFADPDISRWDDVEPLDESVQFTVYRPTAVSARRWSWLLVFAHTTEGGVDIPDPLAEVRRQAEAVLGDHAAEYGTLSADSTGPLRRGSTLLVEPWLDGATFNPATVEMRWEEPVHRADFRFRFDDDAPATARGGVRIFVGPVLVGELNLAIRVGEGEAPHQTRTSVPRFRKVFASYSHADAEVVEAVACTVRLLGDEYLIDAHDLRSGEDWQHRIAQFIEDADVFQLFWSSNALRSREVLAECRHALSLQREGFIRPVYWQDPLPEDPQNDLPPTPIRRLHFSRLNEPARILAPDGGAPAPAVDDPRPLPLPESLSPQPLQLESPPAPPPPLPPTLAPGTELDADVARRRDSRDPAGHPKSGRRTRSLVTGMAVAVVGLAVGTVALQFGEPDTHEAGPSDGFPAAGAAPDTVDETEDPPLTFDGLIGRALVTWQVGETSLTATVDTQGIEGIVDVELVDGDGAPIVVREDLTLGVDDEGWYYAGSSPRLMPGGEPAVDYLSDTFRLTQGRDGLWTIDLVCDATGCYVASTTGL